MRADLSPELAEAAKEYDLPPELAEFLREEEIRVDPAAQKTVEEVAPGKDFKAAEAAVFLNVHVNTLKRMLAAGSFAGVYRVGSRGDWRIPRESLQNFKDRGGTQW